jgi:predicted alpha/beta hydrolase
MDDAGTVRRIAARDGYGLAATIYGEGNAGPLIIVSSATAVPRKIYRDFAQHLARRGASVITYDYRGIGDSAPSRLAGFPARMRDWAELDFAGVIDDARARYPSRHIGVVGHSFGGQALMLAPNTHEIAKAVTVAAQAGYWRLCAGAEKYRVYALLKAVLPPINAACGYMPGSRLGLGEDLPSGVFLEWRHWCLRPGYFLGDPTLASLANGEKFGGELVMVGIDDDPWATPAAIDLLATGFTGTKAARRQIAPAEAGAKRIGHFGFFRKDVAGRLWDEVADALW